MAASSSETPLRFRGGPTALSAAVPAAPRAAQTLGTRAAAAEAPPAPSAPRLSLELPDARTPQLVLTPDDRVARLDVPRDTPPGSYEGTLEIGGETRRVVVDVAPEPFLRLAPPRLVLTAASGERVSTTLELINLGNVGVEVRGAYAFGLFDVGGVERAIARTFAAAPEKDTATANAAAGRADRLADALADEHGGMVRVRVDEGAGTVAPGESRTLAVTLALPDRLRAGHAYWGTWPLDYLRYYVRVTCASDTSTPPAPESAPG